MSKPGEATKWKLIDLDTGEEYTGQYPATGVQEEYGTSYTEVWALGRDEPVVQWIHGQSRSVRLEVRLFAKDRTDDIKDRLDVLKAAVTLDQELGRPHIFRFVLGTALNERVVVESIGNIRYDSLRNDGSLRGAVLSVQLKRYKPFDIEQSDPNASPVSTRYYRAATGETFEHVARILYFNANLGDLLRRLHPQYAILEEGDLIVAPDAKEIRKTRMEPYSVPLTRTAAFVSLRKEVFDRLNRDYVSLKIREWTE